MAPQLSGFLRICRGLDLLERFEHLVPEPVPSPMARLKLGGKQRRRASSVARAPMPTPATHPELGAAAAGSGRVADDAPTAWRWGDEP